MGSWSDLGNDVLQLIAERITDHRDFLFFGAVCTQWRSIMLDNLHQLPYKLPLGLCIPHKQVLPLLMDCNFEKSPGSLDFISIANQKVYSGFTLPELHGKRICGSSNGWLVVTFGKKIHLLNPLTSAQIPLPNPFTNFEGRRYREFLKKVVILPQSSWSNEVGDIHDCIVVSIFFLRGVLSVCRPGDNMWKNIEISGACPSDIIPYKGQVYIVDQHGRVAVCDVARNCKVTFITGETPLDDDFIIRRYLVESTTGDLLQVVREKKNSTSYFTVFKLAKWDESQTQAGDLVSFCKHMFRVFVCKLRFNFTWVKLENLGDQMLFLGFNCSMSRSASLYPNCKGNCIYFTDDNYDTKAPRMIASQIYINGEFRLFPMYNTCIYDMKAKIDIPFRLMNIFSPVPPIWVAPKPWPG